LTQPKAEQRHANVLRLVDLARQFDRFQRQSLFRFLRFVEAQQQARSEPEIAAAADEDAVRLLSIHQSKGLEFPIVAVADLGKSFNVSDLRADLILDEQYGLCPLVKPPQTGRRYPSLPYWLARQRQTRELLGEELRLLYVAMTRARDRLLLSGIVSEKRFFDEPESKAPPTPEEILQARSYSDWLGTWFARHIPPGVPGMRQGQDALLRWQVHEDEVLTASSSSQPAVEADAAGHPGRQVLEQWQRILDWRYPFQPATRRIAKGSVTGIRRQLSEEVEAAVLAGAPFDSGESQQPNKEALLRLGKSRQLRKKASAAEIGTANHAFLQLVSLESVENSTDLQREAARLQSSGALTRQQVALLDLPGVAKFWVSPIGKRIRSHSNSVLRELPFTARFSAEELAHILRQPAEASLDGEFVVIQGVADLVVLLKDQIWLVDFKTDAVPARLLDERVGVYRPQLALYSQSLSRIYRRPVTDCWLYFLSLGEPVNLHAAYITQPQLGI
jgi:ATP-dependent helicase/nuclease subunit A